MTVFLPLFDHCFDHQEQVCLLCGTTRLEVLRSGANNCPLAEKPASDSYEAEMGRHDRAGWRAQVAWRTK